MIWDKILPEPVSSLALFLLLASCVLPTATLTALVLWRKRRYVLGIGSYMLGVATAFNGLVAYAYTPNRIGAEPIGAYTLAERWALGNYVVMWALTLTGVILMVVLFRLKHHSLGFLWLAAGLVEDYVGNVYSHYRLALQALAGGQSLPTPSFGWWWKFWLGLAGVCVVVAVVLCFRRRKAENYARRFIEQRTGSNHVFGEPYGIRRWRYKEQQKRWRKVFWREYGRKRYLAVFLYNMQFYAPPMPPEYRYYELHEFF